MVSEAVHLIIFPRRLENRCRKEWEEPASKTVKHGQKSRTRNDPGS